jgi:uncharacterized tellurite resistance protein B-like protein
MATRYTLEDLVALLERVCPAASRTLHPEHVHVVCGEASYEARVAGSDAGHEALAFTAPLGHLDTFEDRFPLAKLLACVATTACVRAIVDNDLVALEVRVMPADIAPERLDAVLHWRLAELCATALAWRRRLGLLPDVPPGRAVTTLRDLVATTPLPAQKALLVAAVGFAVAGADGRFSQRETSRLGAWLREVPAFAALDEKRVIAAVAMLACDSARTLFEARRHLDPRERLLAWAFANDMAHAEGFTSAEERSYLTSVASIFELPVDAMEPFIADAWSRAVHTETSKPPPVLED